METLRGAIFLNEVRFQPLSRHFQAPDALIDQSPGRLNWAECCRVHPPSGPTSPLFPLTFGADCGWADGAEQLAVASRPGSQQRQRDARAVSRGRFPLPRRHRLAADCDWRRGWWVYFGVGERRRPGAAVAGGEQQERTVLGRAVGAAAAAGGGAEHAWEQRAAAAVQGAGLSGSPVGRSMEVLGYVSLSCLSL